MDCATKSILSKSISSKEIIPYAVDQSIFRPSDKTNAKNTLKIDKNSFVIVTAAQSLTTNHFKNFQLIKKIFYEFVKLNPKRKIILLCLGGYSQRETTNNSTIEYKGFITTKSIIAQHYQAADVYLHVAKAETVGIVILEAMACGIPIIAASVGGIPEYVKSLRKSLQLHCYDKNEATGILIEPNNPNQAVVALTTLMNEANLRNQLGQNAALYCKETF